MANYKYKISEAPSPNLAKQIGAKIGDVTYSKDGDTRFTVDAVDPESGQVSWKVANLPNFDKLFDEVTDATVTAKGVYTKVKDDEKFREFYEELKAIRNKVRTHLRKEYPEDYKRMTIDEEIDIQAPIANANLAKANNQINNASGLADYLLDVINQIKDKEQEGLFNNANIKQAINFLNKAKGVDEAYSGFLRNPEDPDSEKFEPTGAVAEFREDLRALFGKFKGELNNRKFIGGVAEIMVNWKSLLRSQMNEEEYIVTGKKGKGEAQYGEPYKTREEAEAAMDKILKSIKKIGEKPDAKFGVRKGPLEEDDVEEISTSGAAGPIQTPYAFKLKKKKKVDEGVGATLGPGPAAGEDGVKDNAYVKQFKYKLVPKNKDGTYVQKGSGLEVKKLY